MYPVAKLSHKGLRMRRKPGLKLALHMFGHYCLEHWVKKDSEVTSGSVGKSIVIS